jgi:hypothetical protein
VAQSVRGVAVTEEALGVLDHGMGASNASKNTSEQGCVSSLTGGGILNSFGNCVPLGLETGAEHHLEAIYECRNALRGNA